MRIHLIRLRSVYIKLLICCLFSYFCLNFLIFVCLQNQPKPQSISFEDNFRKLVSIPKYSKLPLRNYSYVEKEFFQSNLSISGSNLNKSFLANFSSALTLNYSKSSSVKKLTINSSLLPNNLTQKSKLSIKDISELFIYYNKNMCQMIPKMNRILIMIPSRISSYHRRIFIRQTWADLRKRDLKLNYTIIFFVSRRK